MLITVKDETFTGKILNEISLEFKTDFVTVKDIITERVLKEVDTYNARLPEYFNGLVEPSDAEKTLNGFRLKSRKMIDGEKQVYVALDAFQRNGFFVLVDNIQYEELDRRVELRNDTRISFIKLTPLVGG